MAHGLQLREQATAMIHASMLLEARRQLAMDNAQSLTSTALVLRSTAAAVRQHAHEARSTRVAAQRPAQARELVGFTVEGVVDGQQVAAHLKDGRLECDELLRDRALFLVDFGEELVYSKPQRRFKATLSGRPVAVALTLLRACDRVVALEFDLP